MREQWPLQWVYSGFTVATLYIYNVHIVKFYSAASFLPRFHCKKLRLPTSTALYNHCIVTVNAIAFTSISRLVPTVNLQCSGIEQCKFTMQMSGNTVNLQWAHCKISTFYNGKTNPKPSAPKSSCRDYIPFAYERF